MPSCAALVWLSTILPILPLAVSVSAAEPPPILSDEMGQPDPFPARWEERRRELLELFRTHVYGRVSAAEARVTWEIDRTDKEAMDGRATLKQVTFKVTAPRGELTFPMVLFVPNERKAPAPAFLLILHHKPAEKMDATRTQRSESWPAEEIVAAGFAAAVFHAGAISANDRSALGGGIHALLDDAERPADAWGTIAAWSWGASRVLDYLAQDPDIDGRRVAVLGHSRGGKAALWAGAQDERFWIVISNDSGCTGAALSRRRKGETVRQINASFPHWFCANYKTFDDREDRLPVDQHMLIACVAPRAVYVASASEDAWADPEGEYESLRLASEVWKRFGWQGHLPERMPEPDTALHQSRIGCHVRAGKHGLKLADWNRYFEFARALLAEENR